ncbi:hypothetical protein, partial [Zooshikella harenae]
AIFFCLSSALTWATEKTPLPLVYEIAKTGEKHEISRDDIESLFLYINEEGQYAFYCAFTDEGQKKNFKFFKAHAEKQVSISFDGNALKSNILIMPGDKPMDGVKMNFGDKLNKDLALRMLQHLSKHSKQFD